MPSTPLKALLRSCLYSLVYLSAQWNSLKNTHRLSNTLCQQLSLMPATPVCVYGSRWSRPIANNSWWVDEMDIQIIQLLKDKHFIWKNDKEMSKDSNIKFYKV